jgi:hypothetical protein
MICPRKNSPPLLADDSSSVVVVVVDQRRLSDQQDTIDDLMTHQCMLTVEDIDWLFHLAEFRLCIIIKSV